MCYRFFSNQRRCLLTAGVVVLCLFGGVWISPGSSVADEKSGDPGQQLAAMAWLAGTWSGDMWGGQFVAYYATPEGGKILSYSELRKGEKVAMYEFERFDVKKGDVWLTPFPRGKQAASFRLTELDAKAKKATFESPKNDFPSRIVYHRKTDGELEITLSAPHHGSDQVEVFALKRHTDAKASPPQKPSGKKK